jgi:hypothetical protein
VWRTIAIVPWRRVTERRAISSNLGVLAGLSMVRNPTLKKRRVGNEPQPRDVAPRRGCRHAFGSQADGPNGGTPPGSAWQALRANRWTRARSPPSLAGKGGWRSVASPIA